MASPVMPDRRPRSADLGAPVIGAAVSGVLAYVVFAMTTRTLGSVAAAPVSVLWTYWALAGAAFTFPIQHWVTRTVTAHGEAEVRTALPRVGLSLLAVGLGSGVVAWALRHSLFHQDSPTWPVLVVLVSLGAALMGLVRGGLAARGRFVGLMWSLILENLVRCVAIGALAVAGVNDAIWFGASLVLGHVVGLLWPRALRFTRTAGHLEVGGAVRFLAGAGGGQLLGQVVLTGGPVALALMSGSPAQVTALFSAMALFRAPYLLGLGAVAPLTGWLTGLVVGGRHERLRRFRLLVTTTTVVGTALAGGFGAVAGPYLLRTIFGTDVRLEAATCAVVAAASLVAVANLVITVGIIAADRPRTLVLVWAFAYAGAAVLLAVVTATAVDRVAWAFLAAELVAFAGLVAVDHRSGGLRAATSTDEPNGRS